MYSPGGYETEVLGRVPMVGDTSGDANDCCCVEAAWGWNRGIPADDADVSVSGTDWTGFGVPISCVELAGLPAPPTSHTLHLHPFHPSPTFPFPNYTAGDLEILPDLS